MVATLAPHSLLAWLVNNRSGDSPCVISARWQSCCGDRRACGGWCGSVRKRGVASAAVAQSVTGCDTGSSALQPRRERLPDLLRAGQHGDRPDLDHGRCRRRRSSTSLSALPGINTVLGLLSQSLAETVTYTLACNVDGIDGRQGRDVPGHHRDPVADRRPAGGGRLAGAEPRARCRTSPPPRWPRSAPGCRHCSATPISPFGASVTANTSGPRRDLDRGGQHQGSKQHRCSICADDAGNGNMRLSCPGVPGATATWPSTGSKASTGQLVHNGDCMAESGSVVVLEQSRRQPVAGVDRQPAPAAASRRSSTRRPATA